MNASIKLKEITKFGTGTKLAIFEVTLGKGKFGDLNLESTFNGPLFVVKRSIKR